MNSTIQRHEMQRTLLWSNPDTSIDFSEQRIALSEPASRFQMIMFIVRSKTSGQSYATFVASDLDLRTNIVSYYGAMVTSRSLKFNSDRTKIDITDAANTAVDNSFAIPAYIYGLN